MRLGGCEVKSRKILAGVGNWLMWLLGLSLFMDAVTTPVPDGLLASAWWSLKFVFGLSLAISYGDRVGAFWWRRRCRCDRA